MQTNLTKTTKISKNLILQELLKMKVDHGIEISESQLDAKVNLLFEDCQGLTAEAFVANCKILRKQEMFGKFPPNFKFVEPEEKSEFKKYLEAQKCLTK